jgi:2-polyprenyl-3-methyl-5-hydroxy-6-metoxy-1,4-benzoquinol methylase
MQARIPLSGTMKALEFGAGTGLLSFYLKERFAKITLMDTSAEMLKMAEAKLDTGDAGKIIPLFFDLEKAHYSGEKFDIIFSQMVLHHITDVKAILDKFSGMLNHGGFLAIADLCSEDGSFHDPGMEVHHGFDQNELSGWMKATGFDDIASDTCFIIRRETNAGVIREFPVFLLTAKKA